MPRPTAPPAYTRRIQRLLALINEIKTNPRQEPRLLCRALGVSRAMLYKDRLELIHGVGITRQEGTVLQCLPGGSPLA